jgi:thioredoxin reductase
LYDVTIVGGGPAGMYAAFYSGMRDMKTKLIEAKEELGGRLLIYPEKMIWDVGGVTPIRCERLIQQLVEQAQTFEPTIVLGQQITGLEHLEDGTMIVTSHNGERHHTRTLILTIGYGVSHPAKLELEGANRYEVTNLHYTVTSLESFRGKRVLLSGGSDTAVDWAMELESIAASITMVHRRERLGGHEKNVRHIMESSIRIVAPYVIAQLHGSGDRIEAVTLARVDAEGSMTAETERLEVDAVIINHGHPGDLGPIVNWGLEMEWSSIQAYERMATNIPGVFVAGDTASYPNKLSLIAGAFQRRSGGRQRGQAVFRASSTDDGIRFFA